MDNYHEHPFLNGIFVYGLLMASHFLDYIHIKFSGVSVFGLFDYNLLFTRGVQLSQITLGIVGAVNFYWAAEKKWKEYKAK